MTVFTIRIPGELKGKGRPKFSTRGGFARAYTPAATANMEAWVKHCAVEQAGTTPLQGAVSLHMEICVPVPASWSKKKRAEALSLAIYPTSKPDLDNCIKLVGDALNGILWADDKQIVRCSAAKRYAETAQTVLTVAEV